MTSPAANKALALKALTGLFNDRDITLLDTLFAENYIQHNTAFATGRAGLKSVVSAASPNLKYEPGMVVAEGDYVMVHGRYTNWKPTPVIAVDIFRIANGVLAEHWDVLQDEIPTSQTNSGNPMFTNPQ
jgi:predicted SnoaL-like aldol condensation-catalyzing enzyme